MTALPVIGLSATNERRKRLTADCEDTENIVALLLPRFLKMYLFITYLMVLLAARIYSAE